MKRLHLCIGFAIGFAVTLAPPGRADDPAGDPVRGAKLYSDNCGRCHNARPPATHRDREWSLAMQHMRIVAGLPGQQARDIEAFLRQSNDPPPPETVARASAGSPSGEVLMERYGCVGCHALGGVGGQVGPALDGVIERRGEEWVRAQIRNPRQHNPATIMPVFGLSEAEVTAIVEALRRGD